MPTSREPSTASRPSPPPCPTPTDGPTPTNGPTPTEVPTPTDRPAPAEGAAGESAPVVDAEWSTARLIAHAAGSRVPARVEQLALAAAAGRTLAHDLVARSNLPGFSSSAMDGWAVAGDGPWLLGSAITAGTVGVAPTLRPRTGRPIATGAMIPPGTRAILRSEHGVVSPTPAGPVLSVAARFAPGQPVDGAHIRLEGEEARIGERLVPSGSVLTPVRLALAAAGGHDVVAVRAQPRVRIVVLGDEIIGAGVAMPGLVRDAFGPQLPAMLDSLGLRPESVRHVGDDPARTAAALDEDAGELVVVTGGSSRGTTDHARSALLACGGRILVDGVSMRPGHPVMLGVLGDGRLVLCLPGNPAAGMLALLSIGLPLIDGLLGRPLTALNSEIAGEPVAGAAHGVRLVAATVHDGVATACEKQSAAMLIGLANADTVLVVPPAGVAAGERVTALRPPSA